MKIFSRLLLLMILAFVSCESAEDISYSLDHSVPVITFSNEKGECTRGGKYVIDVFVEDESGLKSVDISYSSWGFQYSKKLSGEKNLTEKLEIDIPSDALLEWEEIEYRKDGSSYTVIETYHKFTVVAYDMNQNKRTSYFYVKAL